MIKIVAPGFRLGLLSQPGHTHGIRGYIGTGAANAFLRRSSYSKTALSKNAGSAVPRLRRCHHFLPRTRKFGSSEKRGWNSREESKPIVRGSPDSTKLSTRTRNKPLNPPALLPAATLRLFSPVQEIATNDRRASGRSSTRM